MVNKKRQREKKKYPKMKNIINIKTKIMIIINQIIILLKKRILIMILTKIKIIPLLK